MNRLRRVAFSFLLVFCLAHSFSTSAAPTGFTIAGTVSDSITSQPLSNAEVTLSLSTDNEHSLSFTTAPDGHFVFSNLPLGKFQLSARRRGYTSQALEQHGEFSTSIVVGPGLDTEHIRFRLAPGAIINGAVVDDSGDSIRGANVLLLRQDIFSGSRKFRVVNRLTTDDLGRYRFAHLQPGIYCVAVSAEPWFKKSEPGGNSGPANSNPAFDVVYPITYYSNASAISDATKITLTAGAIQSADFSLHAIPSVHLYVQVPATPPDTSSETPTDSDVPQGGGYVASGTIRFVPSIGLEYNIAGNSSPSEQAFSESYEPARTEVSPGLIELSGLRPNSAFIQTSPSTLESTGEEPGIGISLQSVELSQTTQINLAPSSSSAQVQGALVVDNAPAQKSSDMEAKKFAWEALILKSTQTGKYYAAALDNRGEFSLAGLTLESGTYELTVTDGDKFLITSITANKTTTSGNTVAIPTGQPTTLTLHANQADCTVKGVALKNGQPLAGAMLVLVPQDATQHVELFHRDQSNSDGSFTLSPVFPGKYTLLALESGWDLEWANPAILFKYLPQGLSVTLKRADTLTLNPHVQ